jgi:hypothetical protein
MGNQRQIIWNQRSEMDGIEHDTAGMSRRLLLGAGLLGATILAEGATKAADAGTGFFCAPSWSQRSVAAGSGIGEPVDVSRFPTNLRTHARRDGRRQTCGRRGDQYVDRRQKDLRSF